ncbi:MAG: hypothetical protein QOJ72_1864, partial [Nocardioidaceae bacterium]|nr:hypothetical protein [Nocardioidaceae bacterium]
MSEGDEIIERTDEIKARGFSPARVA